MKSEKVDILNILVWKCNTQRTTSILPTIPKNEIIKILLDCAKKICSEPKVLTVDKHRLFGNSISKRLLSEDQKNNTPVQSQEGIQIFKHPQQPSVKDLTEGKSGHAKLHK